MCLIAPIYFAEGEVRQVDQVRISYNKFFKLLIDKQMKKGEICRKAGISTNSMGKMAKGQNLTVDMLARMCVVLDCKFDDIMEIIQNNDKKTESVESE